MPKGDTGGFSRHGLLNLKDVCLDEYRETLPAGRPWVHLLHHISPRAVAVLLSSSAEKENRVYAADIVDTLFLRILPQRRPGRLLLDGDRDQPRHAFEDAEAHEVVVSEPQPRLKRDPYGEFLQESSAFL